jgi:hypothetical protein
MDNVQQDSFVPGDHFVPLVPSGCPEAGSDARAAGLDAPAISNEVADYKHVPFRVVASMRVRYGKVTPLRPRRIVLDDDTP